MKVFNKSVSKQVIFLIILIGILVVVFNPQWIPFLSDETVAAIKAATHSVFYSGESSTGAIFLTLPTIFNLIAAIATVLLCTNIFNIIIKRTMSKTNRSLTVASLLLSVVKYASVLVILVWSLSILGVNLTGIFASLGILSLVVGFGAQSLIEDVITGVFIIFEGQYNIGDIIILDDFRGKVKKIGVRTTTIEDDGGNLKIVNNSDIRNLQNRSRDTSIAVADVGISYSESIERVEKILLGAFPKMLNENPDVFISAPEYRGVQQLGDSAVVLRIVAFCREENIFAAQRRLNREIKLLFDNNNIEIPFTQVVLHNSK